MPGLLSVARDALFYHLSGEPRWRFAMISLLAAYLLLFSFLGW